MGGIALETSKVADRGLEHDRRWVLVDDKNYHITQRERPELTRFKTSLEREGIRVTDCDEMDSVLVPFKK